MNESISSKDALNIILAEVIEGLKQEKEHGLNRPTVRHGSADHRRGVDYGFDMSINFVQSIIDAGGFI